MALPKYQPISAGDIFGHLVVLRELEKAPYGPSHKMLRQWECRCVCGGVSAHLDATLKVGRARSCGCKKGEFSRRKLTIHGKRDTPEYQSWKAMLSRCNNPNAFSYHRYGERGITVCDRWRTSFLNFLADMGKRPSDRSLDRIDNDKGYSPDNCRWATPKEQVANSCVDNSLRARNERGMFLPGRLA